MAFSIGTGATSAVAFTEPAYTLTAPDFANCPLQAPFGSEQSKEYVACLHDYASGGTFQIGHATVPISLAGDTVDLAFVSDEEVPICSAYGASVGYVYPGYADGCTVSAPHGIINGPAQPAPGGLLGSVGASSLTAVTAKLESVVSTPDAAFGILNEEGIEPEVVPHGVLDEEAILDGKGIGLVLTAKIHLLNPFLGPNCYIGSSSSPIVLRLTTGTTNPPLPNKPLTGATAVLHTNARGTIIQLRGRTSSGFTAVDNSFSVPVATGCGTSPTGGGLLDAAIDHKLGLPSVAGHNTAVIESIAEQEAAHPLESEGQLGG